jgi:hypothetical protein
MKVIERALAEDTNIPKPRWWGHRERGMQYLMRYLHTMLIIKDGKVIWEYPIKLRTKTDHAGIEDAKSIIKRL